MQHSYILRLMIYLRIFGRRYAPIRSSYHQIRPSSTTIAIDDPFVRPFVSLKKSMGSTSTWETRIGNGYKLSPSSADGMFPFPKHCISQCHCRPPSLNIDKQQAMPNLVWSDCQAGGTPLFLFACISLRENHVPLNISTF